MTSQPTIAGASSPYTARLSVGAAVLGAVGGWYADRWLGAVVGALLMGLVFAPCIGLLAYGLVLRRGPTD
jgi:hypothetical protein